ncbi:BZ3500_MvSof-1268-A1-R1_Chr2-1g04245 [Microbotryum saponariae]|uniref:ferric-chelate reductase (NADPH) n=1 Tax=Microbotryum saponariae TaxID=289078 RepID=A0A2X0KD27_9BASI|nr:BZ3500_MvSof-1268-A1-R1_Chr2-1g04245 [Microbotryum saponariae]SCZ91232.1 BZ3501_MvSof-1269-A2-R1_Chr2-1g03901 [Microbotryum saponariae]
MSSIVASVGSNYVPPFAQTTAHHGGASASSAASAAASGGATGTSISFAKIATGTATASSAAVKPTHTSIISTDGRIDSTSLLEYFTKPYIDAHSLSVPTWRYAYILWFAIAGVLILWSLVYQLSGASRGSALSALFRKYSIKRFVIQTKKPKKAQKGTEEEARPVPVVSRSRVRLASPTYAQIIVLLALVALSCCLSFLGVSYINPRTCTFGGTCPYQSVYSQLPPRMLRRASTSNPGGWVAYTDPLLSASNTDIDKNWWTSAARLGLIAYALLPLCVTLALKQWPFNIWATPFLTDYHYDKTAILHRWSGRIIWLFTSGHVAAWFYQSVVDKDPFGRPVLISLLGYWRFLAGIVGYGLLTLLTLVSFRPIRDRHYELFYWSHVVMVFTLLATCIIHHRPLMWWPIIAAIVWGAERLCRLLVQLHVNGVTKGIGLRPKPSKTSASSFSVLGAEKIDGYTDGKGRLFGPGAVDEASMPLANSGAPHASTTNHHVYPPSAQSQHLPYLPSPAPSYSALNYNIPNARARQLPPPGFASAQILPGRTIRLTIHTPRAVRWQPGQHVFLTLPTLRLFQAHPYTIACCDERTKGIAPIGGASTIEGSEITMLIRAQRGFSKTLWDHVVKERKEKEASGLPAAECFKGVELRALIGWPLGSSCRTSWGQYESLLIFCGGTGVTFGISVLEYICRRLARRDADDRKYKTSRVRFVWILREFAHLTWVAPTLRRCLDMVDPSQLQVEVFVSRDPPSLKYQQPSTTYLPGENYEFAAPSPPFARSHRAASPGRGDSGDESDFEEEGSMRTRLFQRAYPTAMYGEAVESVTDLVLFDGEDDYRTPGEAEMSSKVKKVGKIRRALSRRNRSEPTESTMPYIGAKAPSPYRSEVRDPFTAPEYNRSYSEVALGTDRRHVGRSDSPASKGAYEDTPDQSFGVEEENSYRLGPSQTKSTSLHRLVDSRRSSFRPTTTADEDGLLDVSAEDQADLDIVAEFAKPGYPKLAEILDAEVNTSKGKTMVACCGPNGLNTLVRHLVSSRIEIKKLLKGDPRAQISLVCEDFSF